MSRARTLAISLCALAGCASVDADPEKVPLCGPVASLQPLPERETCGESELGEFEAALSERVLPHAGRALVRVELDDAARIEAVCVGEGPGYGPSSARRALGKNLDAILALSPGPACAAGRRLDLNRYQAALAKLRDREVHCGEQTRITRETHGETRVRDRTAGGAYGVYDREYEHCMEYDADWIALDAPGTTLPAIFVKPETTQPAGPRASETARRCFRKSRVFEKRAACIEAEGWERLDPPER